MGLRDRLEFPPNLWDPRQSTLKTQTAGDAVRVGYGDCEIVYHPFVLPFTDDVYTMLRFINDTSVVFQGR